MYIVIGLCHPFETGQEHVVFRRCNLPLAFDARSCRTRARSFRRCKSSLAFATCWLLTMMRALFWEVNCTRLLQDCRPAVQRLLKQHAWQTRIPGIHSTPVLHNDRRFCAKLGFCAGARSSESVRGSRLTSLSSTLYS